MQKQSFSPDEWKMIKRYLVGGLQVGAGVGVLQAAGNYVHDLGKEIQDKPAEDDDTLFVQMPNAKKAMMASGVGIAGGVLSLVAANAAVRKISQAIKRHHVQQQLDQAQHANLSAVQKVAAEGGHRPLGYGEGIGGGAVALALLSAMASGAITYSGLEKAFPRLKKPANPLPKRVKIVLPQGAPEVKEASFGDSSTETEFVLRMALAIKQAAEFSELPDLVAAVAQGRMDELVVTSRDAGADAMFAITKGASEIKGGGWSYDMAITLLAKSAALGPMVRDLAGAELLEAYPGVVAIGASASGSEGGEALRKFASAAGLVLRHNLVLEPLQRSMVLVEAKQASSVEAVEKVIRRALAQENADVATDPQTVKEHLYRGELLSGISGETVDDVEHSDSNDDESRGQPRPRKNLEEMVMGV